MTEALPLGTSTTQYGERGRETDEQGLNTKAGFDVKVADEISNITGHKFITAPNKVLHIHSSCERNRLTYSSRPLPLTTLSSKLPVHSTLSPSHL